MTSPTTGLSPEPVPAVIRAALPASFELEPARHGCSTTVAFVRGAEVPLVLKRAADPPYAGWLRVEAEILPRIVAAGLPAPAVVAMDDGPHGVWLLLERLPGEPLCELLPRLDPDERPAWLRRTGALLGRIHTTRVPMDLLEHDSTPWWQRPRVDLPSTSSGEVLGATRLHAEPPPPAVFVHGDFTLDNVLADGDALSGVVDWGGAGRGDPRYDLALALLSAGGGTRLPPPAELRAFYEGYLDAVAGVPELRRSIGAALGATAEPEP
ncbi:MAG: phosphotransferase [Myxococcales bacterium]|nr:phosphotransferase [Myxococcales bacterium]